MMTTKDFNKNAKRPQIFVRFSAALLALLCFVATFTACADTWGGNETTPVITDTPTPETEAPHEHSYTSATVAPTCVDGGYTMHVCSCGRYYADNKNNAKGHVGSWRTTSYPTCENEGSKTRFCTDCGTVETESIAASGHKWDGGVMTDELSQQGEKTFTCQICRATKTETVSGTHTYGQWQWEPYVFTHYAGDAEGDDSYAPTMETSHRKFRACSECGYRDIVDYGNHSCIANLTEEVLHDNCVEGKLTRKTCSVCGWSKDLYEESLNHGQTKEENIYVEESECTEMTHQIKTTCLDCGSGIAYSYPTQTTWEHNYDPALGIDSITVIVPDAYDPNPDPEGINWMITRRNVKYDSNGYITWFDIHWHDEDQNCKVARISVADVKDAFIEWGYTFPEGSRRGVEIAIYDEYYVPMRQTGAS